MDTQQTSARADQQVGMSNDVVIDTHYIDADYELQSAEREPMEPRRLPLFRLFSRSPGNPSFDVRWDNGPGPGNTEDIHIDIGGADDKTASDFKCRAGPYAGHHVWRKGDRNQRVYAIGVKGPGGPLFRATVTFNVTAMWPYKRIDNHKGS
jgi:hypothetical protein